MHEYQLPGFTTCLVSELKDGGEKNLLVQADAQCSVRDQYSKNIGRKISLQRAILTKVPDGVNPKNWVSLFLKEDRQKIWEEYFKMRGNSY